MGLQRHAPQESGGACHLHVQEPLPVYPGRGGHCVSHRISGTCFSHRRNCSSISFASPLSTHGSALGSTSRVLLTSTRRLSVRLVVGPHPCQTCHTAVVGLLSKAGILHWTRPGLVLVLQARQHGHQEPVHLRYSGVPPQVPCNTCPHFGG